MSEFAIVFIPGGTVNDVWITLADGATLPNKYNTVRSKVFRRGESTDWQLVLLKDLGEVLAPNDPLLTEYEELVDNRAFVGGYNDRDIIKIDEDNPSDNRADDAGPAGVVS